MVKKISARITNAMNGFSKRWGPSKLKQRLWDEEYSQGEWARIEQTENDIVYEFLEKYCAGGSILDLACGSGNTGTELNYGSYRDYTGIDISEVAIQKAMRRSQAAGRDGKNRYFQSDMLSYSPNRAYDIILVRESIQYIPEKRMKSTVDRFVASLSPQGVFVVRVGRGSVLELESVVFWFENNYRLVEKYTSADGNTCVLVLR